VLRRSRDSGSLSKVSSAPNEVIPGPVARQVIENVKGLREEHGWNREQLSERLREVGRPIRATGLARLEAGKRRVDADDLVAIAMAFGVSPVRLLLPAERGPGGVGLTDTRTVSWEVAWRWMVGELPMLPNEKGVDATDPRTREFIMRNRPFEHARTSTELARWLSARVPYPFTACAEADNTGRPKARITQSSGSEEEADDDGQRQETS
jgi:transcriptional regulator with XRE-family HTH domain